MSVSAPNPNRFRPALEACEDRTVPTTFVGVCPYDTDTTEGGGGTFVLTRWGDISAPLTLSYTVGGTATPGSDHSLSASGTVYFAADEDAIFLQFTATDDTETESAETIILTLDPSTGYTIVDASATYDLHDNDALVTVAKVADAAEGGASGLFRFTRVGDLNSLLTVNYTVTGTATGGTDYYTLSGTIMFEYGEGTADLDVAAIDDNVFDPDKTVVVTLATGTDYIVGTANTDTVVIVDSAALTFTLESVAGGIKYDVPWDDVDPSEASQSLALTNFVINIGGRTFTPSSTDVTFVTAPTAQFEHGILVGITFELDTSAVGNGFYTSVCMDGSLTLTGAYGSTELQTVAAEQGSVTIDFNGVATNQKLYVEVVVQTGVEADMKTIRIDFAANATAQTIRNAIKVELTQVGYRTDVSGQTELVVAGRGNKGLSAISVVFGTEKDMSNTVPNNALTKPKLKSNSGAVSTTYNDAAWDLDGL